MAESLEHHRLAEDLANLLAMAGFAVVRRDAAGWRRPALIHGCRPDLVAWHLVRPDRVLGEAKLGPDLFTARSLEQYVAFSSAPLPVRSALRAHLVLAVPDDHALLAWRALSLAGADSSRVTVAARSPQRWLITSRPLAGVASWPRFAVATPSPSCSCAAPFTRRASAGGDFTAAISPADQT
jgi:hypothetical protein